MSKKIKTLVQKYEKDMQFENRFDELKHKLDLIPDAEIKSEVYTIKKKVMPAYAMMIVLLMLVTGIIGLQFGLNTDFVNGQENINPVDAQLMDIFDIYERESIHTVVLNNNMIAFIYIGLEGSEKKVVIRLDAKEQGITITGNINGQQIEVAKNSYFIVGLVENDQVDVDIDFVKADNVVANLILQLDLTSYFDYLGF